MDDDRLRPRCLPPGYERALIRQLMRWCGRSKPSYGPARVRWRPDDGAGEIDEAVVAAAGRFPFARNTLDDVALSTHGLSDYSLADVVVQKLKERRYL